MWRYAWNRANTHRIQYHTNSNASRPNQLVPPQIIQMEHPLTKQAKRVVSAGRKQATAIIKGEDDRLLVIVGPCSIHDVEAAKVYGMAPSRMAWSFGRKWTSHREIDGFTIL